MFYLNKDYEYINRYDLERFIEFKNDTYDVINTPIFDEVIKLKPVGTYQIHEYPYRPDALSYNIYGETQYWPYLLIYNNITNIMDLTYGLTIKYFSLSDLDNIVYAFSNYNKTITK